MLVASLVAAIVMVILLFFLPAIIELKRPKDAGPRIIKDYSAKITLETLNVPMTDIEKCQNLTYQPATKKDLLLSIPNVEF